MKRLLFICAAVFLASTAQAQTPVGQAPVGKRQFFTAAGIPNAGGKIYTCVAGAACPGNPLATYTDATGVSQNPNPIILDSGGFIPGNNDMWLSAASYKIVAQNAAGATQWQVDNVTAASFLNLPNTWTALQTFSGGLTSTGTSSITNLNGDVYLDGTKYASLAAAVAAVPSGGTVRVSAGTYSITATVNMVSNLDIECSPNNASILQAGASLNAPMIQASGINHFRIAGCVIDGNRSGNANQFNLLTVASSSNGEISGNHFQNNQGRGIQLTSGNSHMRITGNEVNNYGQPLPASLGNEGIVLQPAAGGVGNSHIEISSNRVHDGNVGITVYSSSNTANTTSDIDITHNRCYANANDCILVFSLGAGAPMQGIRVVDNEAYCNGWPANGTGFSANCTAGLLQTGVTASSSGVGIDFNSPLLDQPIVIGNRAHDNFFEGIDAVAQTVTTVNTSGTTVTWVSGDNFNTAWRANQGMRINGVNYLIASVAGAQTTLTLSTSAGVQTGVGFTGIGYMRGTFVGNIAYNNGRGNSGSSGAGFSDSAYGNSWSGNISYNNQAYGFIDQFSAFVTHTGDKAYNNGLRAGTQPGFLAQGALNPSYLGVSTDDTQAVPTQTIGINFDGQTNNAYADSSSILGTNAVVDSAPAGAGNSWRIGKFLSGQPPCLTTVGAGGSYCIGGGATGGAFLATLPAVNGTLSPLIAQECGTTTTCSATNISATAKVVKGTVTLNAATPGVATVTGISPAFTSTSSYSCIVTTQTTVANGKKCTKVSTSSITITGAAGDSDVVDYVLIGN